MGIIILSSWTTFQTIFFLSLLLFVFTPIFKRIAKDFAISANQKKTYLKRAKAEEAALQKCRADKKPIAHLDPTTGEMVYDIPQKLQSIAMFGSDVEFEAMIIFNIYPKLHNLRNERLEASPYKREVKKMRKQFNDLLKKQAFANV